MSVTHESGLPSFSIVLETENLDTAAAQELARCLEALTKQDLDVARANEVLLLDSGDVPPELYTCLRTDYPWLQVHRIRPDTGYYDAKMQGAALASGEVVILCDSDCDYERGWLRNILMPFQQSDVQVVAGETTLAANGPYGVAMAATYIFPRFSGEEGLYSGSGYYCNNVAFRRAFLLEHPIPSPLPIYRGNCVVHARRLRQAGHTIWRQGRARGVHQIPNGAAHFFWRFLLLGSEALALARLSDGLYETKARLPRLLRELGLGLRIGAGKLSSSLKKLLLVIREDPRRLIDLPLALPIALTSSLLYCVGLFLDYCSPGYLLA
ncbi:MAG: glycosyltransferase, partial [Gemmatimonadaceae bacterium]|nr:glycosyltransferase [Gloeobacterales cyanobacterium ES-bin-141]